MDFPIFKTKIKGKSKSFDLNNPAERKKYFEFKAGKEIKKIREYLKKGNTFVAYLLGKKNSGKGTYAKMFKEVVDKDRVEHFSIGDMVREFDGIIQDKEKKKELISFLEKNYRGFLPLEKIVEALEKRSTKTLLPTELILSLVKREIAKRGKKTLFVDGFPRDLDQMNFSLFFRDLVGYREDPDLFILIDVPEKVIDERIKYRTVCPICHAVPNKKLLITSKIAYDSKTKDFILICDNSACKGAKTVRKEGDDLGISPLRPRLAKDEEILRKALNLYGIPKILLRNHVPVAQAQKYYDSYEITPEYVLNWNGKTKKVEVSERPWKVKDDNGVESYSLLAAPVMVSLLKQMVDVVK